MAQLLPSNNIFALLSLVEAIKDEPFDPAEAVPQMPDAARCRRKRRAGRLHA